MKLGDYYAIPEKKGVGVFLACCVTSAAWLFVVTLVLQSLGDLEAVPAPVWHALGVSVDMVAVVLGFGFAWMLLGWPAWQLARRGEPAAKASLKEGIKPMEFGLLAMLGAAVFFLPTILMISDHDQPTRLKCYGTYDEYDDPAFGGFMVPEGATDIKRYYDCGFGYQTCEISCRVSRERLDEFARLKGYRFERRDFFPLPAESSCVMGGLYPLDEDMSRYLYCRARENRKPTCGGESEGNLVFVYDCKAERLYARYDD